MLGMIFTSLSSFAHLCEGIFIKKYQQKHSGGFIFTAMISFFAMLFFIVKDVACGGLSEAVLSLTCVYTIVAGILYASASIMTVIGPVSGFTSVSAADPTGAMLRRSNRERNVAVILFISSLPFLMKSSSESLLRHEHSASCPDKHPHSKTFAFP